MTSTHVFSIETFEPHSIPAEQLSVLLHLNHALGSSLDLPAVLQVAVEGAVAMLGLDTGAVYLIDEGRLSLGATFPELPADFPDELREASLDDHPHIRRAVTEGVLLYVDDVANADLTPAERTVVEARGLTSVLYVPLVSDGNAIGAFIVSTCGEVKALSDADVAICAAMSAASALAIVNVSLFDSLELSHRELIEANRRLEEKRDDLRRLADALARAQDEERRRLAIELHDRVSQPLAVMRMRMATWNQRLQPFDVGSEYDQVMSLLDEAISETRTITSEASPPFLLECGLGTAIGWLCERASSVGLESSCSVPSRSGRSTKMSPCSCIRPLANSSRTP